MTEERRKELDMLEKFARKVFEEIGSGNMDRFHEAFAKVAHSRGIWHHKNRGQYSYFFRTVRPRVARMITNRPIQDTLPL
jgi:hypothetical protein